MLIRFIFYFILIILVSCSSKNQLSNEESNKVSDSGKSNLEGSYSIQLIPQNVNRYSVLSLVVNGFNVYDAKVEWYVNGKLVDDSSKYKFSLINYKKGDIVQVKAIYNGKEMLSNSLEIKNTPPEIVDAKILFDSADSSRYFYVDAVWKDIDGDDVNLSYQWLKNGVPSGNDKKYTGIVKRGDELMVRILPYDGQDYGREVILKRRIENLPPFIIKNDKYIFDGRTFEYNVEANDPDGDEILYKLITSPQGMKIDGKTGLIKWDIPSGYSGEVAFTVSATDGHGGETMQKFVFKIFD